MLSVCELSFFLTDLFIVRRWPSSGATMASVLTRVTVVMETTIVEMNQTKRSVVSLVDPYLR